MKKVVAFIVALLVCLSSSVLADWNVQNLTDEELMDYKRAINEELISRHRASAMEGESTIADLFPDPVIADAVRAEVGAIDTGAVVTQDELDAVLVIQLLSHSDGVTSLEGIHHLRCLEELSLYWQEGLTEIPEEIGDLTQLEILMLEKAGISEIPDSICNLTRLRSLNIKGTNVATLPEGIGNLSSLTRLDISDTQITDLPESIYELDLEKFYK